MGKAKHLREHADGKKEAEKTHKKCGSGEKRKLLAQAITSAVKPASIALTNTALPHRYVNAQMLGELGLRAACPDLGRASRLSAGFI